MTVTCKPLALVVDDEADVRNILKLSLEHLGWMVQTAPNGREGLRTALDSEPQLILIDLRMPEMTGVEFCRRLSERPRFHSVAIIMMSAVNERARLLSPFWELPLANKRFLKKPFGSRELQDAISGLFPYGLPRGLQSGHITPPPAQNATSAQRIKAPHIHPNHPASSQAMAPELPAWMQPTLPGTGGASGQDPAQPPAFNPSQPKFAPQPQAYGYAMDSAGGRTPNHPAQPQQPVPRQSQPAHAMPDADQQFVQFNDTQTRPPGEWPLPAAQQFEDTQTRPPGTWPQPAGAATAGSNGTPARPAAMEAQATHPAHSTHPAMSPTIEHPDAHRVAAQGRFDATGMDPHPAANPGFAEGKTPDSDNPKKDLPRAGLVNAADTAGREVANAGIDRFVSAAEPTPQSFRETPSPAEPPEPKSTEHFKGYRILCIDDNTDQLEILMAVLGQYHEVLTAINGMDGLNKLNVFSPDFVITDINMPELDGLQTAAAIRRHPRLAKVPIFFLTGEKDGALQRKAYDVGGNLYLCKPIDPQKLLRYIDYFLEQTGLTASGNIDPNAPDPVPVVSEAVRVLTIDYNIENHRVLQRLFGQSKGEHARVNGGPFEMLWAEDPRQAMVDLTRWDPDVILYNPRNPGMDGAAFGKILGMHETGPKPQTAFVGTRFTKADHDFSNANFGRDVIELGLDLQKSCMRLNDVVAEARKYIRPKRHDIKFIETEIADRSQNRSLGDLKKTRERDTQRQRFQTIQAYIDRQFN